MATTTKKRQQANAPQLSITDLPVSPEPKPEPTANMNASGQQPVHAATTTAQPPATQPAVNQQQVAKTGDAKWMEYFESSFHKYEQKVLPELLRSHNITTAQFKHIVVSEVKKNVKLFEAFIKNPSSMFASILAGAEIGLIPSAMLGEFFLIPRTVKGVLMVTPQIGYKGLHTILMRSGDIVRLHTEVVFEGERFEPTYGLEPNIIHIPNYNVERTAAKITHVYAVAKYKNGSYQFVVMSRGEVEAVRKLSPFENTMYFSDKDDPMHWMVKKTALFQLGKMLPKDYHSKKAIDLDARLQGGATLVLDETGKELFSIVDNQIKPLGGSNAKSGPFTNLPDAPAANETAPATETKP